MSDFNIFYAQGLAYCWGRNDQNHETAGVLAPREVDSVKFATEWAEVCARGGSRPDLSKGFENFRDHGRVLGPDKVDFTAYYQGRGM